MLLVQAHVELLKVADTGADMGNLIHGDGLAEGGASGQHGHQ